MTDPAPNPDELVPESQLPRDPRFFVLDGLGLEAEFLDLDRAERAETLNDVEGTHLRRHLGRAVFYTLLILAFVTALRDVWLITSCGLVAIFAGKDLAKFVFRRRLLAAARSLFLGEVEQDSEG